MGEIGDLRDGASPSRPRQKPRQPLLPLATSGLVDDGAAAVGRLGLVPGHLRGDGGESTRYRTILTAGRARCSSPAPGWVTSVWRNEI